MSVNHTSPPLALSPGSVGGTLQTVLRWLLQIRLHSFLEMGCTNNEIFVERSMDDDGMNASCNWNTAVAVRGRSRLPSNSDGRRTPSDWAAEKCCEWTNQHYLVGYVVGYVCSQLLCSICENINFPHTMPNDEPNQGPSPNRYKIHQNNPAKQLPGVIGLV